MQGQARRRQRKTSILERIKNILSKLDQIMPYAIVGGGTVSALYYPEGMKGISALLLAYILAKAALADLEKSNPKKAEVARKATETLEKALQESGVNIRKLNEEMENG